MTHGSVLVNFAESPHFLHYPRPFTGTSFRNTKAQFRWNHHPFVINSNCICNKATNVSIVVVQFTIHYYYSIQQGKKLQSQCKITD